MKFIRLIVLLTVLLTVLISCGDQPQESDVIALINDEIEISFTELNSYHSSHFFERRYTNAELKAFPLALDELALREMKLIDFFEQGFDQDSVLMLPIQRTINEELVNLYFDEIFFKNFVNDEDATGSRSSLENRFLDRALVAFDEEKMDIIDQEDVEWNEEAVEQVKEWGNIEDFFDEEEPRYRQILSEAVSGGYNPVIMSYQDSSIDVEEYHRLLDEVLILENNSSPTISVIKNFILEAARTNEIIKKAQNHDLHKNLVSINTPSNILKSRFITLYSRKMIFNKIPEPTEENLREFYEQEKDGELYQLAKRIVYVSFYDEEDAAQQKWEEFQQGSTFEEITNRRWAVKSFVKEEDGQINSYNSNEEPYLGEQAFSMQQGDVIGPVKVEVPNEGEKYAIIKCNLGNEEGVQEFSEIKNIEKRFTEYHRSRYENSVEERLKNTYPVEVHKQNLERKVKGA